MAQQRKVKDRDGRSLGKRRENAPRSISGGRRSIARRQSECPKQTQAPGVARTHRPRGHREPVAAQPHANKVKKCKTSATTELLT